MGRRKYAASNVLAFDLVRRDNDLHTFAAVFIRAARQSRLKPFANRLGSNDFRHLSAVMKVNDKFWQGFYNALPLSVFLWLVIVILFFVFTP